MLKYSINRPTETDQMNPSLLGTRKLVSIIKVLLKLLKLMLMLIINSF